MSEDHRRIQVWGKLRGSLVRLPAQTRIRCGQNRLLRALPRWVWKLQRQEIAQTFSGQLALLLGYPYCDKISPSIHSKLPISSFNLLSTSCDMPLGKSWLYLPNNFPVGLPWSSVLSCLNKPISLSLTSNASAPALMVLVHFPKSLQLISVWCFRGGHNAGCMLDVV